MLAVPNQAISHMCFPVGKETGGATTSLSYYITIRSSLQIVTPSSNPLVKI